MPDPKPATPAAEQRSLRPLAAAGMLIVAITLTLAGLLVSSYHDTIAREQTNLRNLAEAFAAQTHYATLALDLSLAGGAGAAIVRAVVALGHGLAMRIVAEGVESEDQLAMLRALGCDEYQGYLFARPMPAGAVPALLLPSSA